MSAEGFLVTAYIAAAGILVLYLIYLTRKQRELRRRLFSANIDRRS